MFLIPAAAANEENGLWGEAGKPSVQPRSQTWTVPWHCLGEGLGCWCGDMWGPGMPSAQDSYLAEKRDWV